MAENIERFNPYCGCTENMSECNTVVKRVAEVPSLRDATRNHVYLLPNNTAWIVNSDGTGFSQLNSSSTGEAYDDTELTNRIVALESKTDSNTLYRLKDATKILLNNATLKNLIESHNGTSQPLLLSPSSVLNGTFSFNASYGKITAKVKYNDTTTFFTLNNFVVKDVIFLSLATVANLDATKTILGFTGGDGDAFVTSSVYFASNFYQLGLRCMLDNGINIGATLDLVALKSAFEASPTQPVVTKTETLITGEEVTLEVDLEQNFYTNTRFSVREIGKTLEAIN